VPQIKAPVPPDTRNATEEPTTQGAFSEDGVDLTVIRWMLRLTPAERLQAAQDLIDAASALRSGAGDGST
jgi:hypothetical protein